IHLLKKKWVVVIFSPKKDYSVVPINWLVETETQKLSTCTIGYCYWPSIRVTSTDLKAAVDPDQSWCQYKIRVVGGNKTYSNFNKAWHERIEIESTDNESILNEHHPFKRNKKNKTVDTSDSSENEDSTGYTIVPSSKQNELLFNTSHTEYSTHTDTIQTLYTNTQQQPSISTSTDGKNSIITQVDSYTNVQPSSSFSATPTFSANQEKSYTDLEVRSLTSPNSSNVQESSMMEQFTFEPFYTGSQVNHLEVLSQPLSQVSPE
ncbi:PREDICTED: uncharacterized protein LOC107172749, partial [Diuraphis noxia]|uniref:uncharacterized protein LOC107172749 n=1 Tax=Diuraphis noxia TaxID=143948 RepID=UPI000763B781